MGRGRGFLSELNRIAKAAEADARRREREAQRQRAAAQREAERAQKAKERALAQAQKAAETERKRFEKEAKLAHIAAQEAKVEELMADLEGIYDDLDNLLAATIEVDDYVDLESLRAKVEHPPFPHPELEQVIPVPDHPDPPKPTLDLPEAPSGLGKLLDLGRHSRARDAAKAAHAKATENWKQECKRAEATRQRLAQETARANEERKARLAAAKRKYQEECARREEEVATRNAELDELIANLGYAVPEAIEKYVDIVLSNSVYPDHFPVEYDFEFSPESGELKLTVLIPAPEELPSIKAYRYVKSKDEITSSSLSQKAVRERYTSVCHQVAVRTLHEVFEADRRGLIRSIALTLGTNTIHPATGLETLVPFVGVGAERDTFVEFDLSSIIPSATLEHLGAALSKDPTKLVPADLSGIRSGG